MTTEEFEDRARVGNVVHKIKGDYHFEGVIVAAFVKRNGTSKRYVIENADGILHIFSATQLKLVYY